MAAVTVLLSLCIGCSSGSRIGGDVAERDDGAAVLCGDGVVGDGEECDGDPPLPCTTSCGSTGERLCRDCRWDVECSPPEEVCNGTDDDCDTVCDDGFGCCAGKAGTCVTACGSTGRGECSDACVQVSCAPPEIEICNGTDDDCDGRVDEQVWCPDAESPFPWFSAAPWASARDDLWTSVGGGMLARWNGERWTAYCADTAEPLVDLWGSGVDDVWAVGSGGTIARWDGAQWRSSVVLRGTSVDLRGVGGTGRTDAWAVGESGTILHWDGADWGIAPSATTANLHAVRAGDDHDAWAVGAAGAVVHWDGEAWHAVLSDFEADVNDVLSFGPSDAWIVGDAGLLAHWDGAGWTRVAVDRTVSLRALFGTASDDIWAVGSGTLLLHWDGASWRETPAPSGCSTGYFDLAGTAADDVWAVGGPDTFDPGCRLLHWDGAKWFEAAPPMTVLFEDVSGSAPDDIWAVGLGETGGIVLHGDGTTWDRRSLARWPRAVWAAAPDDAWVADPHDSGSSSDLWHWNGSTWRPADHPVDHPLAIWGSSPSDVWVTGSGAQHWDGAAWTVAPGPYGRPFYGFLGTIWGFAPDDVWAGGSGEWMGTCEEPCDIPGIFHWDGLAWSEAWTDWWPRNSAVVDIWGTRSDDVWAIERDLLDEAAPAPLLHWNGGEWWPDDVDLGGIYARALGGPGPDDVWVVGDGGAVRRDGVSWSRAACFPWLNTPKLWTAPSGDIWAAGWPGILHRRP
ncbi:MAG: hypothetical protein HY905_09095 [Deltaproteobacteria bacterium]|nr:hypothetical protein [Deltaproteobacteria bacterium]